MNTLEECLSTQSYLLSVPAQQQLCWHSRVSQNCHEAHLWYSVSTERWWEGLPVPPVLNLAEQPPVQVYSAPNGAGGGHGGCNGVGESGMGDRSGPAERWKPPY